MLDASVLYPLLLCVSILIFSWRRKKSTLPYPPGPKGYPILGNVLDLPMSGVPIWESLTSLADSQGTDLLYLRVMGKDMVALSSNEAISDLLDKRSSIYSDKPQSTMMVLSGATEWALPLMSYGDRWRVRRKLCHEALNGGPTANFDTYRRKYVHRFLSHLLGAPENFMQEVGFIPGAITMAVTYGIDVKSTDDPFLVAAHEASLALGAAMVPGKFLVDTIPMLRHLPDWFPGTGFKAIAEGVREKYRISINDPVEYVKNAMKSGEGFSHSITSDYLSRLEGHGQAGLSEEVIRDVSGILFVAAAQTTKLTLQTFFLAMALNPEVVKKAHEELDRVVGKGRLPDFADRDDLPYINAVVKELFRWNPPFPISVPGRVTQDDVYRGYLIPAGATVIGNIWAICRDPDIYPDPEAFNPDRFLKDGKINPLVFDPEDRGFGAGRRICPGKRFAIQTVYLVVACVLSTFNVGPALGEDGSPEVLKAEFDSLFNRNPKPFKCTIEPRSDETVKLVKEACDGAS